MNRSINTPTGLPAHQSDHQALHPASPVSPATAARGVSKAARLQLSTKRFPYAGFLTGLLALTILFTAVSYMVLRDDIMGATLARQARMQQAYEDRISALRSQVDLVTSRQLIDQRSVENRVNKLLVRQKTLGSRRLLSPAGIQPAANAAATSTFATPKVKSGPSGLRLGSLAGSHSPFAETEQVTTASLSSSFETVEATLEETERAQLQELNEMHRSAQSKLRKLAAILKRQGVSVPETAAVGGPLIELKGLGQFSDQVSALDASLETLEIVRRAAKSLPHGSPAPGKPISSKFGSRRDPFTKRRAIHGGLDFKAKTGSPVIATASGTVTKAGRSGGYGRLIEIDHGGGITTRYAHLSRIHVKVGQKVERGKRIGRVGSTGRSTGPHLHYEVRRKGRVLNPIHYVRLEKHLKPLL